MKIIFLDIDGVLNSETSCKERGKIHYNDNPHPMHIKWLNYIVEKTNAYVVISSTWRRSTSSGMIGRLLFAYGFKGKVIDKTPCFESYRGTEIKAWILEHLDKEKKYADSNWHIYKGDIESFVILDDDSDMGSLMPHLVQTHERKGLLKKHAIEAIKVLNKKWDKGILLPC